ncbi:MAG: SsrA-binding protein SmpB [Bdellovibrionales bacterium]|nr:SsrA-binding protein SmpB [Bdellovibrionales bacterium]
MAEGEKLIATNPNARSDYFIQEIVEAGMVLTGTEIKSLRSQSPNLRDAYVEISGRKGAGRLEAWLSNAHIAPYSHGNIWNHDPLRKRKLLLQRHQIEKLFGAITQDGITVIPMRMYFKKGMAKVELGLGKGKKKYDKRQDIKKKSQDREIAQSMKSKQSRGKG